MNVLITSAGRKVWLVKAFQRALAEEGGGKVVAMDCDPLAAALVAADEAVCAPPADAGSYLEFLLNVCDRHEIGLLVPTRDEELPWFADRTDEFAARGTKVAVSQWYVIEQCQDKKAFITYCLAQGFSVPVMVEDVAQTTFPVFVRPRRGKAGKGARAIHDRRELLQALADDPELLVQEYLQLPEYTLDVFADFSGRVLSIVPRRRLRVSAGESVVGVTVDAPELVEVGRRLCEGLGLVGHITVQCFWDGENPPFFIEVNPRIGGGAMLGIAAGADTPRALVRLVKGLVSQEFVSEIRYGLYMMRHSNDFFVTAEECPWLPGDQ